MRVFLEASLLGAIVLMGQVAPGVGEWTHFASLPFAFAAASFLIWSMVQIFRLMFDSWKSTTNETIAALRGQLSELQRSQKEQLISMNERTVTALEHNNETIAASIASWHEVHEDLRDLLTFAKGRPCMVDKDANA